MVQRNYLGVSDPVQAFEDLKPLVARLAAMQNSCRPFGRDYHAIAVALDALNTTAYHFTRQPHFFIGGPAALLGPR